VRARPSQAEISIVKIEAGSVVVTFNVRSANAATFSSNLATTYDDVGSTFAGLPAEGFT
jgi:hypothetical protein